MIHEFLTNPDWLNPQLEYLIRLQNIRLHLGPVFDNFFLNITKLGELLIPTLFMCIIYWCIDFEAGVYLFLLNSVGLFFSKFFKMIACVYRPWIYNSNIVPVGDAVKMAAGYSFPSGHCLMAATSWGGIAFLIRKHKILCTLIILSILLIAFSRNYVGVHTPQDVWFGVFTGLIFVFVIHYLLKWCEKDKNRYFYLMAVMNLIVIASMFYVIFKQYPADYIGGKLLVNPAKAIYISVLYAGWIMGLFNGAILCKRFFPYNAKESSLVTRIVRGFVGALILLLIFPHFDDYLFSQIRDYKVAFSMMFCTGLFITAIYPFIFTKIKLKKDTVKELKSED